MSNLQSTAANFEVIRGAAPRLPQAYSQAIDSIEIGPSAESCSTAVFCGHSIYVCAIERDELWLPFKDLAAEHGLRACCPGLKHRSTFWPTG